MQVNALGVNEQEKRSRLLKLLIYRGVASLAVLIATIYFFYEPIPFLQRRLLLGTACLFFLFIAFERYLISSSVSFFKQILIQFGLDLLLVSVLVIITGGIQSPFVFLFGLLIVAAGTQSHVLAVLLTTILACICYLASIYGYSLWNQVEITAAATLHMLLQVSALFLVGGTMAAIARRHASLQQESHHVVRQHRRLKELHEQVVSSMKEGILILDHALYIQDSNESARRLLSTGDNPDWLKLEELGSVPKSLIQFLLTPDQELFQCEWSVLTGTCLVTATALPGDDSAAQWLLTLVDITDIRQLEKRLAQQDKLAAMGKMVAMLAHEVRNPMQTIAQSVEIMRSVGQAQQDDIQRIVSEEVARLNRLVSDLLDYVHPLSPESVDASPSEVIGSSVTQNDLQQRHQIKWSCEIDSLILDSDHFRLVLDNLLRNALQVSTLPGSIEICMQEIDGSWELSVSDQGGGVSEEMKGRLFEPFATGRPGGVGLGLATVWQVCQVNGWQVEVKPISDGSCFVIRGEMHVPNPREE